ncbi:MAG: hypothetical protein KAJ33_05085 [Thermoplasmata archaeon]|nr:hypothetical protein [Thermoplasmata archaeon]
MNKMMIAGLLIGVLMLSTLGVVAMAQETGDTDISQEVSETQDEMYLITPEQNEEIRDTVLTMQEEHATRTEIRETARTMSQDFIDLNLESYGLTEAQIDEIQAKINELMDKMDEIHETRDELWDQDMNRMDIRDELQPLRDDAQEIRAELKDLLDQYGIIPPKMRGSGMDEGHGPGQGGRPGRFGDSGGSDGEGFGPGQGGRPGMFGEPGEFCDGSGKP